ncbi:MAG: hypothetical protein KGQ54_04335 [Verrucomicrobia bacterium]|nr:hypothetical protein [Verrucomicrobiota bacterium]
MTPLPRKLFERHGMKGVDILEEEKSGIAICGQLGKQQTLDGFAILTSLDIDYIIGRLSKNSPHE